MRLITKLTKIVVFTFTLLILSINLTLAQGISNTPVPTCPPIPPGCSFPDRRISCNISVPPNCLNTATSITVDPNANVATVDSPRPTSNIPTPTPTVYINIPTPTKFTINPLPSLTPTPKTNVISIQPIDWPPPNWILPTIGWSRATPSNNPIPTPVTVQNNNYGAFNLFNWLWRNIR